MTYRRQGNWQSSYGYYEVSDNNENSNLILDRMHMPLDGWVERIGVRGSSYLGGTAQCKLVIYNRGNGALIYKSLEQNWGDQPADHQSGFGIRYKAGEGLGFMVGVYKSYPDDISIALSSESGSYTRQGHPNGAPDVLEDMDPTRSGSPGIWFDYIPNIRPLTGSWRAPTPNGMTGDHEPTFSGTIPHDKDEEGRDSTAAIQLRIFDETENRIVYDQIFQPTKQEIADGYFRRQLITHEFDHKYWCEFRHQDQFSVWSYMSSRRYYNIVAGPHQPFVLGPVPKSKINVLRPQIKGTYSHPSGIALNAAAFRIWNRAGTVILAQSGWQAIDSRDGSDWILNSLKGVADLKWGTWYGIDVATRDSNLSVSEWSTFETFKTNEAPFAPSNLFPAGSQADSGGILRASVGDVDGDAVTQAKFWLYKPDGTAVTGWNPKTVSVPAGFAFAEADMKSVGVLNTTYTWKCQAYDGLLWGPISITERFTYALVPTVTGIHPGSGPRINRAFPVSPNYDNALTGVSFSGADTNKSLSVVEDPAAPGEVEKAWLITKQGGDGDVALRLNSKAPAAPGENWVVGVGLKRLTETPLTAKQRIICYDSADTVIASIDSQLGARATKTYWDYNAGITSTALPANTASISVEVLFDVAAEVGEVRVDAWMLRKADGNLSPTDFQGTYDRWFGPFSGDTLPYGDDTSDYRWDGTPGYSNSIGLPVLTEPSGKAIFSYTHPDGLAIHSKRIVVEKFSGGLWRGMYDSGYVSAGSPADYSFRLPARVIQNESRCRINMYAKDSGTAQAIGASGWIEFDVAFPGPPELEIEMVTANEENGTLQVTWTTPGTNALEFFGYEVAVESFEEGEVIFSYITDPTRLYSVYHFPVSGRQYLVKVRQVALQEGQAVASRWSGESIGMDYSPRFFLKNMQNPLEYVVFEPLRGSLPSKTGEAPIEEYLPLFSPAEGGAQKSSPIFVIGPHRYETGSFQMVLWPEDQFWTATPDEQRRNMKAIDRGQRFACLLSHLPPDKNFIVIKGISYSTDEVLDAVVDVEWSDARFEEDIFLQGNQRYALGD